MSKYYLSAKHGLWSPAKLSKRFGIPLSQIKGQMENISTYQQFKSDRPKSRKFAKIVSRPRENNRDYSYQGDLLDLAGMSKRKAQRNKGIRYLLLWIDTYSRFLWCFPLKSKTLKEIYPLVTKFLRKQNPFNVTFDGESAINSRKMKEFLSKNNIKLWLPEPDTSFKGATAMVERVNRTIRGLITKYQIAFKNKIWIDDIDTLIANYNTNPHRSLNGKTPKEIYQKQTSTESQEREVTQFKPGDRVRVRRNRKLF